MARLIVKLHDDTTLPYVDNVEQQFSELTAAAWQTIVGLFPAAGLRRLFGELEGTTLDQVSALASEIGGQAAPRLDVFYVIDLDDALLSDALLDALITALSTMAEVEFSYVDGTPELACVDSMRKADNPVSATSTYWSTSPIGVGADTALTMPGGSGVDISFADVEFGWLLDHEDIVDAKVTLVSGENSTNILHRHHGTAVLSVVLGQDNAKGLLGIASDVHPFVASVQRSGGDLSVAMGILEGAWNLFARGARGAVLLIEVSKSWANDGKRQYPVETHLAEFLAIRTATFLGVTVVEPAGNQSAPLDLAVDRGVQLFDRTVVDSGAILVGASDDFVGHSRWASPPPATGFQQGAGFGSRVDCFAMMPFPAALATSTTAYNGIPGAPATFNATSAAACVIASTVAAFQGMALALTGSTWKPTAVRAAFSDPANGTPSPDPIGVMPDLDKLVGLLGARHPESELLAAAMSDGSWLTIRGDHELIYLGRGVVLDVHRPTGEYRIWPIDRQSPGDPLPGTGALGVDPMFNGIIRNFDESHRLVYIGREQLLDWKPSTREYRVHTYIRSTGVLQRRPGGAMDGTWSTIDNRHELVYIGNDEVLDWVPSTKRYRVFEIDRADIGDPLPGPPRTSGNWLTIGAGHRLVWLGGDNLLDWVPTTADYRLFTIDRSASVDPVPGPARIHATFTPNGITADERMLYVDANRLLTWQPGDLSRYRLWRMRPGIWD